MSLPRGYVDPSSLAGRYPASSEPPLPDTFITPSDVVLANTNAPALGALALLVAGVVGGAWWLSSRKSESKWREP